MLKKGKKKKVKNVKEQLLRKKNKLKDIEDCINSVQSHFTHPGYDLAPHVVLSPREESVVELSLL